MADSNELRSKKTGFEVSVRTDLVTRAGLKPWQLRYLAVNVASRLDNAYRWFETPDQDRNPGKYLLTIHEQEGSDWLGLVNDSKRFRDDVEDPEEFGYPADYKDKPVVSVVVPNIFASGPVALTNSRLKERSIKMAEPVVTAILEEYVTLDDRRPPEPDNLDNLQAYIKEREQVDKVIFRGMYDKISNIMRS